jgi:hypothetical protein
MAFPGPVFGPVERAAFRRLAAIFASDAMTLSFHLSRGSYQQWYLYLIYVHDAFFCQLHVDFYFNLVQNVALYVEAERAPLRFMAKIP